MKIKICFLPHKHIKHIFCEIPVPSTRANAYIMDDSSINAAIKVASFAHLSDVEKIDILVKFMNRENRLKISSVKREARKIAEVKKLVSDIQNLLNSN